MNIEPITHLSIDGKRMPSFTSIKLKQKINDHHQFKIILDTNVKEVTGGHTIDKSKDWLGKIVVITFKETEFLGIITNISLSNSDGHSGFLVLKGYSPTILLEGGKHMCSWTKTDLESIVNEILDLLNVGNEIKPVFTDLIEYEVQYNETHYHFLQRLAKQYNEWFFYNGIQVVFGKPKRGEPIEIEYGTEITDLDMEIKIADHNHTLFAYNASEDNFIAASSNDNLEGLNDLGIHAFLTSSELYKQKKNTFGGLGSKTKRDIDILVERKQAQVKAGLHIMKAKSTKQGLTVGSIIKVKSAKVGSSEISGKSTFAIQNYGEYMITSIKHKATERSEYTNEFTAIPSGILVPEEPKVKLPKAEPQLATVIANKDEKGQGRVKVKFQWQIGSMQTSWIRVMTPDAGKTDKHGEIRGNVVIPETGDQVMIGFEYNNPNLPFVMGSMYHGTSIKDGMENKNSLISRLGSKLIMDDNDGSLQLTDKGGVDMKFDGKGNLRTYVYANNTMNAGAIHNVNVGAKKDTPPQSILTMDKDGNILLDSKTSITLKVNGNSITIDKEGIVTTVEEGNIESTATIGEVSITGNKDVTIVSETANANFKAGIDTHVRGVAKTIISGGEVEINRG